MLEYIFLDERPYERFRSELAERKVDCECEVDDGEYLVKVSEDLDPALIDAIEEVYDRMMGFAEELIAEEEESHYHAAGVEVCLPDGRKTLASVSPAILNKVLQVLEFDELQQFVDAIAAAAISPDERPICKR